jgi:fumarate hydratase subunit alpha
VERLFIEANYHLPPDMVSVLEKGEREEQNPVAKSVFRTILDNRRVASEGKFPLCQDCGMAVVFLDMGQETAVTGGNLENAVNEGVRRAYDKGYLRKSIVEEPLFERKNTGDNTPAILHVRVVPGERVAITVAPKGAGSENMSALAMLSPAAGPEGVERFVIETVRKAGPNPCPPIVVGVGVGSDFEGGLRKAPAVTPGMRLSRLNCFEKSMISASERQDTAVPSPPSESILSGPRPT